jgi:hypothetical protein
MKCAGAVLLATVLCAQGAHDGSGPVQISGRCTAEIVQALSLPCSEDDPCPMYLELADVEAVGGRLVLTGNIHTGAATVESVLLISDDGGRTWTEPTARIPMGVLDRIQFFDVESGWISGHLLQGIARDAFLLLTKDGGKTWRKRDLTSDRRSGVIDQFWFDTREHGMLSIDRIHADNGLQYELWESMTGGESWSIRQVHHEPLTVKRPDVSRTMRIRPDAAAGVNRIERSEAGKWIAVAAFSLSAGACKPEEQQPREIPPPEAVETPAQPEAAPPAPIPSPKPPSLRRPSP